MRGAKCAILGVLSQPLNVVADGYQTASHQQTPRTLDNSRQDA